MTDFIFLGMVFLAFTAASAHWVRGYEKWMDYNR